LFFGLQIDPATLPAVLPQATVVAVVTAVTKLLTGYWATRRAGVDAAGGGRAGAALVARGEFSIVIAELGVNAGMDVGRAL
jgi:CPA2 family monovalent cation:H+ antiporter-2